MKRIKLLSSVLALGAILFVSSCSNQMYSYRKKVKVDTEVAKIKKAEPTKEIESKVPETITLPVVPPATAPELAIAPQAPQVDPKLAPAQKEIQSLVPNGGSKAHAGSKFKAIQSTKELVKNLKKEVQKSTSVDVDGKRWMIIGLIVWLIGAIIGLVLGSLGWIIATVGGVIFLIGLIFWLMGAL
ncbi:MAG: hypothetical protein CFE21_03155 [Bacteroidetes bacterium B1(2017)]|nr:MAG: hypothetical protein CFE21_03155 [Bacteroidetes bacterium B1(2017)]